MDENKSRPIFRLSDDRPLPPFFNLFPLSVDMNSLLHPSFCTRFLSHNGPNNNKWYLHTRENSFVSLCSGTQLPLLTVSQPRLPVSPEFESNEEEEEEEVREDGIGEKTLYMEQEEDKDEEKSIPGIPVPRQRYIPVSKRALLEGLLSMFDSEEEAEAFRLVCSCVDSIIHAEHKATLEEMRLDFALSHQSDAMENEESETSYFWNKDDRDITPNTQAINVDDSAAPGRIKINHEKQDSSENPLNFPLYLSSLLSSTIGTSSNVSASSRIAVATRFQRSFLKLLHDAQFEELSIHDLQLTSALNTDYLLNLPIYVDWKRASESNAIIFRRGFAAERQKGLLIGEKLDYIQSRLLQQIFGVLSKPLEKAGTWINEWVRAGGMEWTEQLPHALKKSHWSENFLSDDENVSEESFGADGGFSDDLPMWLAAQRAVPRYEGLLSSVGPRGRLLRRLLAWIGLIPTSRAKPVVPDDEYTNVETYLRPNFLSRITLRDIWKPATKEFCENDLWKMFKTACQILFSKSILQEPAFKELILLYSEQRDHSEINSGFELPSLQMKIYERIPIPDLPVIFPHKKLSFRILDTVRLDVASILGLLAYLVNYKFENILLSPSSFLLDVIALTALVVYVTRVALGYKQTWDRYQLLVNKTLYEKTLASGFGTVYFLLDASEQQQYKEAILAYAYLLQLEKHQVPSRKKVADMCERFIYDKFKEKVEMPIDKAINTLLRLGLVVEFFEEEKSNIQVLPCLKAYEGLKRRWECLLASNTLQHEE